RVALGEVRDGLVARHDGHIRHRQHHFLARHLPEAHGGLADAEVDQFGQRVELQLAQRHRRLGGHCGTLCCGPSTWARNSPSALAASGLGRNAAPVARARLTTSTWWLAEITARWICGFSCRTSAASARPSLCGML